MIKQLQDLMGFVNKLSRREKAVLYGALLFVTVAVLDRAVVSPALSRLKALDEEIASTETGVRRDRRIISQEKRIGAYLKQYEDYLVPERSREEEFSDLLKEVETVASAVGVSLLDLKPGDVKEDPSLKKYLVSLTCEASLGKLSNFIHGIEISRKLLKVEKFQISPRSRKDPVLKCSMTIAKIILSSGN